jgi:hypothetical protein
LENDAHAVDRNDIRAESSRKQFHKKSKQSFATTSLVTAATREIRLILLDFREYFCNFVSSAEDCRRAPFVDIE